MTRSYWTAAAAAVIAFGIGMMMSANATSDQTGAEAAVTELTVLQQIEKNTETTDAQLILLNQQIAKLASALAPKQSGQAPGQGPNPPPARN